MTYKPDRYVTKLHTKLHDIQFLKYSLSIMTDNWTLFVSRYILFSKASLKYILNIKFVIKRQYSINTLGRPIVIRYAYLRIYRLDVMLNRFTNLDNYSLIVLLPYMVDILAS